MYRFYKDYGDKKFEPFKPIEISFIEFFHFFTCNQFDLYSHQNFEMVKRLVFKIHDIDVVDSKVFGFPVYLTMEFTYGE